MDINMSYLATCDIDRTQLLQQAKQAVNDALWIYGFIGFMIGVLVCCIIIYFLVKKYSKTHMIVERKE